ncbi:MAG: hypothetical protein ABIN61_00800 [candidate division WOR-3 bacterium]
MKNFFFLFFSIFFIKCAPTISYFDSYSYKETISAKVETLELMGKGTKEYLKYEDQIEKVLLNLKKQYEYEKNKPKNYETSKMWEIILEMFNGFIEIWRKNERLNDFFINEVKIKVEKIFNLIIDLESKKIKKEEVQSFIENYKQ